MPVYVTVPGELQEAIAANDSVRKGDVLARLSDPDLDRQILEVTNRRNAQALRLQDLQARQAGGPEVAAQIPTAKESLADLEERLRQLEAYRDLLLLKSPATGAVYAPPLTPQEHSQPDRLGTWSGSPLEEANRGCWLEAGTLLCTVAERDRFEAIAFVDQQTMDLVRAGQSVRILLQQRPGQILRGVVRETARTRLDVGPRQLAAAGDLPGKRDTRGGAPPGDNDLPGADRVGQPRRLDCWSARLAVVRSEWPPSRSRGVCCVTPVGRFGSAVDFATLTGEGVQAHGVPTAPEIPGGSRGRGRPSGWVVASAGGRAMPPHSRRSGRPKSPAAKCPTCSHTARG